MHMPLPRSRARTTPQIQEGTHMARSFARTLADLNTKLNRQKAAVENTLEMIEAVTELQKKENETATPAPSRKTTQG